MTGQPRSPCSAACSRTAASASPLSDELHQHGGRVVAEAAFASSFAFTNRTGTFR